jgi:hypothetical protein
MHVSRHELRLGASATRLAVVLLAAVLLAPGIGGGRPATAQSLAAVPGVVVRSLPTPEINASGFPSGSRIYTTSPSIAVLPNGDYVITDNDFGSNSTASESGQTYVFRSTDRGQTWTPTATLDAMKRGSLFVHQDALHLMGYTTDNSGTAAAISVIRRSTDNGVTWTTPTGSTSPAARRSSGPATTR